MNLLVLNYEYPPLGGGAGEISRQINKQLVRLGYNITVLTTLYKDLPEDSYEDGVRIIRLPSKRKVVYKSNVFEMLSWVKLAKRFSIEHIKNNKVDLVFSHFAIPGGLVASFINKKLNIPYVIMSHGHDIPWFFPKQMFLYHLLTYFKIHSICKKSVYNFVQTEYMKNNIDKLLGNKYATKNILITNGFDADFFNKVEFSKNEKLEILFVGRLVAQKNPLSLINALQILAVNNVNFNATIIGDGPLKNNVSKLIAKYNLSKFIKLTGWVSKHEIRDCYNKSHVFVLPTLAEGMSIAILEALGSGLFVITTPISGNTELIKNNINGKLVQAYDINGMAKAISDFNNLRFSNEYNLDTDSFRNSFCWKNIVAQYHNYLSKI